MIQITIAGAGYYGTQIAQKYKKFQQIKLKAVVSKNKIIEKNAGTFLDVPFFISAKMWKNQFGIPTKLDVFDLCVHQNILLKLLGEFIDIGAKNFILPKPLVLTGKELDLLQHLVIKHDLNIVVSSQWHYSSIIKEIQDFVKKNRSKISHVDINFSRSFTQDRVQKYTAMSAFLPHMLQILFDTNIIKSSDSFAIRHVSNLKINLQYYSTILVNVESDLSVSENKQILNIYFKDDAKPAFSVDFSRTTNSDGSIKFPSISSIRGSSDIKEDVLEKMIEESLPFFELNTTPRLSANVLTFDLYILVAREIVKIVEESKKLVVIIGGGIFGSLSALEIAKKGIPVVLFEKNSNIIGGASIVNQCRVHMGYHYPRDEKTAADSLEAKVGFEKFFNRAIVKDLNNYYLVAKEGSLTTKDKFLAFCNKMNLPYERAWPLKTTFVKENISLSLKVPETIFDAHVIRDILLKKINNSPLITLVTSADVTALNKTPEGFSLDYKIGDFGAQNINCRAAVNATYSNLNYINSMLGLPNKLHQFELCEVPVAKVPWIKVGWSIIDGPFFGVMPFGFSKDYLLYDVELSVLERSVDFTPKFKHNIEYYNDPTRKMERFLKYKKKWRSFVPEIDKCESISSMYVTRVVLPKKEKTDSRPSTVDELIPGFWQIFSGKVTTSVPCSIKLANLVNDFIKEKSK